jgi:hypothetical protein
MASREKRISRPGSIANETRGTGMFGKNAADNYEVIEGGKRSKHEQAELDFQGALFPFPNPRSLIFVQFSAISQKQFLSLVQNLHPVFVVDMRSVPRFDLGRLNRQAAFEQFTKNDCTYIDLSSGLDPNFEKLGKICNKVEANARPIMFLMNIAIGWKMRDAVVRLFNNSEKKWDVYDCPNAR